jgi:hypothetical protein
MIRTSTGTVQSEDISNRFVIGICRCNTQFCVIRGFESNQQQPTQATGTILPVPVPYTVSIGYYSIRNCVVFVDILKATPQHRRRIL